MTKKLHPSAVPTNRMPTRTEYHGLLRRHEEYQQGKYRRWRRMCILAGAITRVLADNQRKREQKKS